MLDEQKNRVQVTDLYGKPVSLSVGIGSYIDPEVIVDLPDKIHIGNNTIIRKGVVLRSETGEIFVGDNCVINHYTVFHAKGGIYIGDWTVIAPQCGFYAQNHSFDQFDIPITLQPNIGKGIYLMGDNWIGSHSVLCDDVTLGKGTVIGANSTVTRSLPMAVIAVGSPAKVTKNRFPDSWDFRHRERAVETGMPSDILDYVLERGRLLKQLVGAEDIVLDLGCGEGIITAMIAENTPNSIGCDYCCSAVEVARAKYPQISFVQSNVTNLEFEDETFTKVIFSEVAEHLLPVQFAHSLREIARALRKDGTLLLTTPVTGKGTHTATYSHIYEYSAEEIHTLLGVRFSEVKLLHSGFGLFAACGKK
jgi:acetyltransferase-like isoleucine patch superfamily enzyme